MPSKDTKILEFNRYQKSDKIPPVIHVNLESLIKRIDGCENSFEKSSTIIVGQYNPSRYSMFKVWTFVGIEIVWKDKNKFV